MEHRYALTLLSSFVLLFLLANHSIAQPNPTYQITVEAGGNIGFEIFSIDDYETGGISYAGWTTRLNIVYTDTTSGQQANAWRLGFRVMDTELLSSYPGRTLPLDIISLQAASVDSLATNSNLDTDSKPLSNSWTSLVENASEGVYKLSISYTLDSALIGRPPAFYNSIIEFQVVESGDPFN